MKGIVISPVNMKNRADLGVRAGDIVRVSQKIQEKGKTRLQEFEGLVLAVKHGKEAGSTFTVRKVTSGVGVERTFPLYSPMIDSIEIVRRSKVRRAKLYHVREQVAREAKRTLRRMSMANLSTSNETAPEEAAAVGAEDKKE
jgi:large subunit ribosomal protein L19